MTERHNAVYGVLCSIHEKSIYLRLPTWVDQQQMITNLGRLEIRSAVGQPDHKVGNQWWCSESCELSGHFSHRLIEVARNQDAKVTREVSSQFHLAKVEQLNASECRIQLRLERSI